MPVCFWGEQFLLKERQLSMETVVSKERLLVSQHQSLKGVYRAQPVHRTLCIPF